MPPDTMLRPPVTFSIHSVQRMLSGARVRHGMTPARLDEIVASAGIAPALFHDIGARVTAAQYIALFERLIRVLDDECLGLLGRPLRRGTFVLVARSALGAPSLELALRRAARTFNLLQDDVEFACVRAGALAGISLRIADDAIRAQNFLQEMLLRVAWQWLAWLSGGPLPLRRVDFCFDAPPYAANYAQAFATELRLGQPCSALWFDHAVLGAPLQRDADALNAMLRRAPGNLILPQPGAFSCSARVRALLRAAAPAWPELAITAGRLHMSESTLQRRLAAEGTSYQSLKNELRRDLAIVRLNTSEVPLAQLALELGFADTAAFQRAFKGWTGSTPGSYRQR